MSNISAILEDMDHSSSQEMEETQNHDSYPDLEPILTPPTPITTPKKASPKPKKRPSPEIKTPPAKRAAVKPSPGISGDDSRLLKLKDEGKSWKEISTIFKNEGRATLGPGALAKRYSRLGAKLIVWEEHEVEILLQAIAEVERKKWENVSLKMIELGEGKVKKFPATACEKKAKEKGQQKYEASQVTGNE